MTAGNENVNINAKSGNLIVMRKCKSDTVQSKNLFSLQMNINFQNKGILAFIEIHPDII